MRDQRIISSNRKPRIPSCVPNFLDPAQYIFVLSCLIEVITLAGILSRAVITHLLRTRRLPRRGPGHAVPAPAEAAVHVRVHPGHATQHLQHRRQVPHRLRARLRRGQIPQVCGCQSMNVLNNKFREATKQYPLHQDNVTGVYKHLYCPPYVLAPPSQRSKKNGDADTERSSVSSTLYSNTQ